ncbi:hypothetical protein HKX48_004991 [Thoreauomyces humboldtii]|nr:hypothetical protein HKX48_004991 [Thoreauomyces humboldtii]
MDELLTALLKNAASNPNPDTLSTALAVADRIKEGNEANERQQALLLQTKQAENRALALRVREKELDDRAAQRSTSVDGIPSSQLPGQQQQNQRMHHNTAYASVPPSLPPQRFDDENGNSVTRGWAVAPERGPGGSGVGNGAYMGYPNEYREHPHHSHQQQQKTPLSIVPSSLAAQPLSASSGGFRVAGHEMYAASPYATSHPGNIITSSQPLGAHQQIPSQQSMVQYPQQNISPWSGGGPVQSVSPLTPTYESFPQASNLSRSLSHPPSNTITLPSVMSYPHAPPAMSRDYETPWSAAHHALFTFGMEDFGHGNSMPQFQAFMNSVASEDSGSTPDSLHFASSSDSLAINTRRLSRSLMAGDGERTSASINSGSDVPDNEDSPTITSTQPHQPRKKRQVNEEDGLCRKCGKQVAVFLLHGDEVSLAVQHEIDIICLQCAADVGAINGDGEDGSLAPANIVPGSKRTGPARQSERAACDVCKRTVAVGSVRLRADPNGRDRDIEPDFEVEIICTACRNKYALCTECGGGGKYRTGKWRPLGLFLPGRRTCKLPHVRIGSTPIRFSEWLVPSSLEDDLEKRSTILSDIEKSIPFMYYHRLAVPEVMELCAPNELATFELLEKRVDARCKYLRAFVLDKDIEPVHHVRRYFGAAWIERISRHKKDKRPPAHVVKISVDTPSGNGEPSASKLKHITSQSMMIAMITVWWDCATGCLRLSALQALNTEFTSSSLIFRLTRRVIERCVSDQQAMSHSHPTPPIEILGLPVFMEFARLPGVQQTLERLGFLHLDEFEKAHPELDRRVIERSLVDVGGLFGGFPQYSRSFYVGSVSKILSGPWGLDRPPAKTRRKPAANA